jgi:hypothetical protein
MPLVSTRSAATINRYTGQSQYDMSATAPRMMPIRRRKTPDARRTVGTATNVLVNTPPGTKLIRVKLMIARNSVESSGSLVIHSTTPFSV